MQVATFEYGDAFGGCHSQVEVDKSISPPITQLKVAIGICRVSAFEIEYTVGRCVFYTTLT